MSRRARFLASGLVAVAAALSALLLLEGALRLLGIHFPTIPQPERSDSGVPWTYDATLGWYRVPGTRSTAYLGGPDAATVRINSLGFRGGEVARERAPDELRVLVVGDSFAFGVGVDEAHTFSSELERRLAAISGRPTQVLNLGVVGYSTDQEFLLLRDRGIPLNPDLVVLAMCDNDFLANTQDFLYHRYYKPYVDVTAAGEIEFRNIPVPRLGAAQRAKVWLCEHSRVWNMLRSRSSSVPALRRLLGWFEPAVSREAQDDPVFVTYLLVRAMRDLIQKAGAEFVTFNVAQRGEDTRLFQALRVHLRRDGIRFVGLEGALGKARQEHPDGNWDFGRDHHWNVDAAKLAAREIAGYLEQAGLRSAHGPIIAR